MKKHEAKALLSCHIDFTADFHSLRSSKVEMLLEYARKCGYYAPKNANGSRARYFFYNLVRLKP